MKGKVISVVSGKGGVGKSTFVANISVIMAKMNYKVLAVDYDIGLRNLDLILGMQDMTVFDFSDAIDNNVGLSKIIVGHPEIKNLYLLNAPQIGESSDFEKYPLKDLINEIRFEYDYIFIDCPAGIGKGIENAADISDLSVVIATPDITSIRDADRVTGVVYSKGAKDVWLVINRLKPRLMKKKIVLNVDEIIDRVSIRLLGLIPEDEIVTVYTNKALPLVLANKDIAEAYINIAKRISGKDIELHKFW